MTLRAIPRLRIVILDHAVSCWDHSVTRDLFHKIVNLKLKGYGREYSDRVLALDTFDFIGAHLLLCEERPNGELHPLMGYKSAPLKVAEHYNLQFPAFALLRSSGVPEYIPVVEKLIEQAKRAGEEICYDSSWTIDQKVKEDRDLNRHLRKMFTSLIVNYHRDFHREQWITCGVVHFKTDQFFTWLGGKAITEPFPQLTLDNSPVSMIHIEKHSKEAVEAAKHFEADWENRIVVTGDQLEQLKKAA